MNGALEDLSPTIWTEDAELAGVLFVLDAPLVRGKAWPHIDTGARTIEWDEILDECHSSSEELMVRAAMALWSRGLTCDLSELQFHLDDDNVVRIFMGVLLSRRLVDLAGARRQLSAVGGTAREQG
jgi:hypothetical protein